MRGLLLAGTASALLASASGVFVGVAQAAPVSNLPLTCSSADAIGQPQNNCGGDWPYLAPNSDQLIVLKGPSSAPTWARAANLASSDTLAVCSLPVEPGNYSSCKDSAGVRRIAYLPKSQIFAGSSPPPPPPPPPAGTSGAARVLDLSAPAQITEPGLYVLDRSWELGPASIGSAAAVIVISSGNVTLDLRGFRLTSGLGTVIQVTGTPVTVRNGELQLDGGTGIHATTSVVVSDMRVLGSRGTGIRFAGGRSILTNSVISSNDSMTGVEAGDNAIVRDNWISSRFISVKAASHVTVADNEIDCGLDDPCIEVEGTNTVVNGNKINDRLRLGADGLVIRGNFNHVMDNVVSSGGSDPCTSSPGNRHAIIIDGQGNTIRNNLVPSCAGFSGWDNGITFLRDGNFYGGNAVWATTPFNVGATVQTDQGGNVGNAQ